MINVDVETAVAPTENRVIVINHKQVLLSVIVSIDTKNKISV